MDWHKRFKSKGCILKLKAASKEEALNEVVDQLASSKLLPRHARGRRPGRAPRP